MDSVRRGRWKHRVEGGVHRPGAQAPAGAKGERKGAEEVSTVGCSV